MLATVGRIRRLTPQGLNSRAEAGTEARLAFYAGHPEQIEQRLRELDEEWDIERSIEVEAAGTVLTGCVLGMIVSKKWFLLSAFASGMILLHSLHGEYPLLPLFRRLGFRTAQEIENERYALKALRGDFKSIPQTAPNRRARAALDAAEPAGGKLSRSATGGF